MLIFFVSYPSIFINWSIAGHTEGIVLRYGIPRIVSIHIEVPGTVSEDAKDGILFDGVFLVKLIVTVLFFPVDTLPAASFA